MSARNFTELLPGVIGHFVWLAVEIPLRRSQEASQADNGMKMLH